MCKLLTRLLDIIFPPRVTEKIIRQTDLSDISQKYRPNVFEQTIYLSDYKDEIIRSAVVENKFHNNARAALLLGRLVTLWLEKQSETILFIPIPLGCERQRQRGYNQVENILKSVSSAVVFDGKMLGREIETIPQTKLDKADRLKNMKDVFGYKKTRTNLTKFSTVVIIDDVVTTGATLESASIALTPHLPSGMKLLCLAVAH